MKSVDYRFHVCFLSEIALFFPPPRLLAPFTPPFPRPRASGHGEDRYDIADLTIARVVLRLI